MLDQTQAIGIQNKQDMIYTVEISASYKNLHKNMHCCNLNF